MAIKVKKKVPKRKEATEPDQIYTRTEQVFNYLETNRKVLLGSLLVLLVGIGIVAALIASRQESATQAGAEVFGAVQLLRAPTGENAREIEGLPVFDSEESRAQEIRTALSESLDGSEAAPAARMLAGAAAFWLDDDAAAQEQFEAASGASDAPLLSLTAMQALAAVQADSGDLAAARGTLEQLATLNPSIRSYAEYEIACQTEAAGEYEEAHRLYLGISERYGGFESGDVDRMVAEQASHRADVLAVVLGIELEDEEPDEDSAAVEDDESDATAEPADEEAEEAAVDESAEASEESPEASEATVADEPVESEVDESGESAADELAESEADESAEVAGDAPDESEEAAPEEAAGDAPAESDEAAADESEEAAEPGEAAGESSASDNE